MEAGIRSSKQSVLAGGGAAADFLEPVEDDVNLPGERLGRILDHQKPSVAGDPLTWVELRGFVGAFE